MTSDSKTLPWENLDPEEVGQELIDAIHNLLNSDDPEIRMEALGYMFDMSYHQGSLCLPASFVLPCFIDFLPRASEREKTDILSSIAAFATGYGYLEYLQNIGFLERDETKILPEDRAYIELEERFVGCIHEAVYKGFNFYLHLLEDDSPQVRSYAAYVLSCCLKNADIVIIKLRDRFQNEPDETVKATIIFCLAFISKTTPVDSRFFAQIINSDETDIVKLSAAVSLAYIAGEKMSDNALEKLIKLLEIPDLFNNLCELHLPMTDSHQWIVIDFFTRLSEEHKAKIIPVLLQVYWDFDEVINLPFQWQKIPERTTFDNLTESQQFVLRAIANDEPTWNKSYLNQILTPVLGIKGSSPQEQRQKLIDFINGKPLKYD